MELKEMKGWIGLMGVHEGGERKDGDYQKVK